jgi:hypothetical protein
MKFSIFIFLFSMIFMTTQLMILYNVNKNNYTSCFNTPHHQEAENINSNFKVKKIYDHLTKQNKNWY